MPVWLPAIIRGSLLREDERGPKFLASYTLLSQLPPHFSLVSISALLRLQNIRKCFLFFFISPFPPHLGNPSSILPFLASRTLPAALYSRVPVPLSSSPHTQALDHNHKISFLIIDSSKRSHLFFMRLLLLQDISFKQ